MNDTSNVTTLALLNLIRLLAAEMVAGEHRDDVAKLIQAMDRQLDATPLPRGIDVNDARAGIGQARDLLRPHELAETAQARDHADEPSVERNRLPVVPRSKYFQ